MRYLYVMDWSNGAIYELEVDPSEVEHAEDEEILDSYGIDYSNCEWMFTHDKLEFKHLDRQKQPKVTITYE